MAQVTSIILCEECQKAYRECQQVFTERRAHHWSFWCRHSRPEGFTVGHEKPYIMWIGQLPG